MISCSNGYTGINIRREEIYTNLENRIAKEREALGLTQVELSEKANVSRAIISGLESGRVTVTTTETLQKIAKALNKSVGDIFF